MRRLFQLVFQKDIKKSLRIFLEKQQQMMMQQPQMYQQQMGGTTTETGSTSLTSVSRKRQLNTQYGNLSSSNLYYANAFRDSLNTGNPEDEVFGRNIFNSSALTFEPNLNLATPENYRLGPGDEVVIYIWGASENTIKSYLRDLQSFIAYLKNAEI